MDSLDLKKGEAHKIGNFLYSLFLVQDKLDLKMGGSQTKGF